MTDPSSIRVFLHNLAAAAVLSLVGADVATGQTATTSRDSTAPQRQVAVVIWAEATAGQVSFVGQPQIHVRLSGGLDSVHVIDRKNLPSPVVSGTTYRDVHVAVEIFGRLNAECIARTLTGGAAGDCASLELRGGASAPSDTARQSKNTTTRPPRN